LNFSEKIFLASTSPRRLELLKQFGFKKIEIIDPQFNENKVKKDIPISKLVVELSNYKAQSALKKLKKFDGFIISGDTEVYRCKKFSLKLVLRLKSKNT
jgi:septum formation protein